MSSEIRITTPHVTRCTSQRASVPGRLDDAAKTEAVKASLAAEEEQGDARVEESDTTHEKPAAQATEAERKATPKAVGKLTDTAARLLLESKFLLLQGFDREFSLCGNHSQKWRLLGNTIPTIFTKIIGERLTAMLIPA